MTKKNIYKYVTIAHMQSVQHILMQLNVTQTHTHTATHDDVSLALYIEINHTTLTSSAATSNRVSAIERILISSQEH